MVYDITNAETFKNLDKYGLYPPPPFPFPSKAEPLTCFPNMGWWWWWWWWLVVVVVVVRSQMAQ
jgi:hypothetical protein